MDRVSASYLTGAALAFLGLCYKLRDLYRFPKRPLHRVACLSLLVCATVACLAAPAVRLAVDQRLGIPNVTFMCASALYVYQTAVLMILVTYWRAETPNAWRRSRWWVTSYGCVIIVIAMLFALADTDVERPVDYAVYYARMPPAAAAVGLAVAASAAGYVAYCWMCLRWSRAANRPWMRYGLRTLSAAFALALGFDVLTATAMVARWGGGNLDYLSNQTAQDFSTVATLLGVGGFILPALGPRISRPYAQLRAYRSLRPLWEGLRRATPQIEARIRLPLLAFDLRLHRRMTEIADGHLALRGYFNPAAACEAISLGRQAGMSKDELLVIATAAEMKAAIAAKVADLNGLALTPSAAPRRPSSLSPAAELTWMLNLAQAFGSPITDAAANPTIAQLAVHERHECLTQQRELPPNTSSTSVPHP